MTLMHLFWLIKSINNQTRYSLLTVSIVATKLEKVPFEILTLSPSLKIFGGKIIPSSLHLIINSETKFDRTVLGLP